MQGLFWTFFGHKKDILQKKWFPLLHIMCCIIIFKIYIFLHLTVYCLEKAQQESALLWCCVVKGDQCISSFTWCHLPCTAQGNKEACYSTLPVSLEPNQPLNVNMLDMLWPTGLEQHPDYGVTWLPPLSKWRLPITYFPSTELTHPSLESGCALMQHHKGWAPPCRILEAQREGWGGGAR